MTLVTYEINAKPKEIMAQREDRKRQQNKKKNIERPGAWAIYDQRLKNIGYIYIYIYLQIREEGGEIRELQLSAPFTAVKYV